MKVSNFCRAVLRVFVACGCFVAHAQENSDKPVFTQNLERTIIGANRGTLTRTTQLGNGYMLESSVGTRSFETVEQSIARSQAIATQPGIQGFATISHVTVGLELNKTFNINDNLGLLIFAGLEGRIPATKLAESQGIHSEASVIPYAGARIEYESQNTGTYDASLQVNGTSLLPSSSRSTTAQPAMASPILSPITVGIGWITGKKKRDKYPKKK